MINKKYTLTIGIPAYNEEANIGYLIKDILKQMQSKFVLEKIIISSDGSSDKTVEIASSFKNKIIEVLDNKDRGGQKVRQNQVIKLCKSDILVLLNADIALEDEFFIEKLISPILTTKADLVSSKVLPIHTKHIFEKILYIGIKTRDAIFENYNDADNVYTCHGAARALSKKLYTKFNFFDSVGEDAYSYFYAKTNNYVYKYAKNAVCLLKLPEKISDHEKQSIRFSQSKAKMAMLFGENYVQSQYKIPRAIKLKETFISLLKSPFYTTMYLIINTYTSFKSLTQKEISNMWEVSVTSKSLR